MGVDVSVGDGSAVVVRETVAVGGAVGIGVSVAVGGAGVAEGVTVAVGVSVGAGVTDWVTDGVGVTWVGDAVREGGELGVVLTVGVMVAVHVTVGDRVELGVHVIVGVRDTVTVVVKTIDGVALGVDVSVDSGLGVGVLVMRAGVWLGVGDGSAICAVGRVISSANPKQ